MKVRWILLAAALHYAATFAGLFLLSSMSMSLLESAAPERQMRLFENIHLAVTLPVGFLQCGRMPFVPLAFNSLGWGWLIVWIITMARRRRTPTPTRMPTNRVNAEVLSLQALILATFCFAITPASPVSAVPLFVPLLIVLVVLHYGLLRLIEWKRWTPERQNVSHLFGMLTVLMVAGSLTIVPWPHVSGGCTSRDSRMSFGETVTRLKAIQERSIPFHLTMAGAMRWRTDFNANRYFSVLDRLTPREGYTLDYVYVYDRLGGHPILYARPQWTTPFLTHATYQNASRSEDRHSFLVHVRTDGTPDGFIQFVILYIMADQFYLFWHGGYNDERIVHDQAQLNDLLSRQGPQGSPTVEERQRVSPRNLQPVVDMHDEVAKVTLFTWTDWGGLYRKTYAIGVRFPHIITETAKELVVPFQSGILF